MYDDIGIAGIDIIHNGTMYQVMGLICVAAAAYLIGNISPAILIGRAHGIDIKKEGSGNAGTTNVLRTLGKKAAVLTLLIDVFKGVLAVVFAGVLVGNLAAMTAAVAVFCGHVWPIFFGFKGGKGVATAFGALTAIHPGLGFGCLGVVAVCVILTKRMSAGSIVGAIACPVLSFFIVPEFTVPACIMAVIVIYKHKDNIKRLMRGEEPKLDFKSKGRKKDTE
jgi:glycerol-3-phosphate acyltransferase PlsY